MATVVLVFAVARALYPKGQGAGVVAATNPTTSAAAGAIPVSAARVQREDLARTITVAAEFQPFQQIDLHAKVAGYVRSIRVDVGDHVKAGEVLAVLEVPELDDDLKKAAAATRGAREELKRAEARYNEVHSGSQRLIQVARERPNLVAQQDIDSATAEDTAAAATVASARQHVEESEANESRMQTMVGYRRITAPFDGVVTRRHADVGALIQAGTSSSTQAMPLVSLAQDSLLRLSFPVPESAVAFIHGGAPVTVDMPGLHRTFTGKVARYSGAVDRATRTMLTEIDVPNADRRLTPGMYASVTLALEQRDHALSVPVEALSAGQALVVGEGGRLESRAVHAGLESPERVEVLDGLREGELVVLGGRARLRAGDTVAVKVAAPER
jgi:RND family efflux transporter MFP subunit